MVKTLELQFETEAGKTASLSVESPKEPIEISALKEAMEKIISSNVFYTDNGHFTAIKGARVVERNIIEYEVV
ncbi:DUF2922 domain-containing protein [Bacillus aquiflavi]|uniref:DUF2922 domain-containing protein n=1 Tax=Bacillus aquiflavi TaxID=2672567 RepID=A0A6B3VZS1_9BACI|nr:DUF2922 domain-containing protein [Bacillus aquiflavi]MBA4538393.1 DUF2922 domain-containing protein [Bacillus aquiflavi]NEY82758.1 DUF2922 domain-containing protein [Bacillus aquiflavi]UAC49515.1 DUF2922 domain-containing protein [Bacillus aquiflavi]